MQVTDARVVDLDRRADARASAGSFTASSSTAPVSRISPTDQRAISNAPASPITGSSHVQPSQRPSTRAVIAAIEVSASASTCR